MAFLEIAEGIADLLGIHRPVGEADPTARRFFAAAKATGEALYRAHDWSVLHREFAFETEVGEPSYALPDDWGRAIRDTAWDRTSYRRLRGNQSPQQWQVFKSALIGSPGLAWHYRLQVGALGGNIVIDPTPGEAVALVIEYVSRFWAESGDGDGQDAFWVDSDQVRLDPELFRLGLLWRMRRSLGLAYADDRLDYEVALKNAIKADINLPSGNLAPPRALWPQPAVLDGSWPQL